MQVNINKLQAFPMIVKLAEVPHKIKELQKYLSDGSDWYTTNVAKEIDASLDEVDIFLDELLAAFSEGIFDGSPSKTMYVKDEDGTFMNMSPLLEVLLKKRRPTIPKLFHWLMHYMITVLHSGNIQDYKASFEFMYALILELSDLITSHE